MLLQSNVSFVVISQEAAGRAIGKWHSMCVKLPEGLKESDKLPELIYTPSTKLRLVIMMKISLL